MDRESWVVSSHGIPCLGSKPGTEENKSHFDMPMTSTDTSIRFCKEVWSPACMGIPPQVCAPCSLLGHLLGSASVCSAAPRHTSSPKQVPQEGRFRPRSPVHLLLTTPADGLAGSPAVSAEHSTASGKPGSPEGAATAAQRGTSRRAHQGAFTLSLVKQKVYSVINELGVKCGS